MFSTKYHSQKNRISSLIVNRQFRDIINDPSVRIKDYDMYPIIRKCLCNEL